ncbi:MAG TPA: FHA domain-containing protein [Pyrinomonadaceae bacterium]|jgi:hypothetical protein
MIDRESTFVVTRADRSQDPVTFVADGLALGRLLGCEVCLNHPSVSRLHAGVRETGGVFYLFHLSPSNSTTLNGKLVEGKARLADGDSIQIGPFFILVRIDGGTCALTVRYQAGVRVGDVGGGAVAPRAPHQGGAGQAALDVFWEKRKREAGKMARPSELRPRPPAQLGKTRYNWTPTRDLARPYPFAVFLWATAAVAALTAVAAFGYSSAFAPAPLSGAHARASLLASPAVASRPNANSCTTCHALSRTMDEGCASCHQTAAFDARETDAHRDAGVGCAACHGEHRGAGFRPAVASLAADFQPGVAREETCAGCHNDANAKTYNGRRVATPHGGTFGYPVVGGRWNWKGLDEAEWGAKPEEVKNLLTTWKATTEDARRGVQFHALHLHRVRAAAGLKSNEAGELTCSSCHKSLGATLDRATPRTTCALCHDGRVDDQTGRALVAANAPDCASCHVEHAGDRRPRGAALLTQR